jgi:hypothetical protein
MKTDGLSINLATVRHQFDLKTGVEACLRHGITAISPWRDHIHATGVAEAARIIRSNGMKVTGATSRRRARCSPTAWRRSCRMRARRKSRSPSSRSIR